MSNEIRCALSPILIYTDMSQPGGRSIQVGFVAELTTPTHRIMGLIGREALDTDELAGLRGLLRRQASTLWDFLASEFELACGVEPGRGLEYLAARHSYSLSFETPKEVRVPKSVSDAVQLGKEALAREFREFLWGKARGELIQHETAGIRAKIAP